MVTNKIGNEIQKHAERMKKEIHQGLPFSGCYRDIPLPEGFGEVVAPFVTVDSLPPIYAGMTMRALWG